MTTGRKVRLLKAPATISSALMITKIRLKYVNTFSFIMSLVVFAVRSICTLTLPCAVSSLTRELSNPLCLITITSDSVEMEPVSVLPVSVLPVSVLPVSVR